MTKEEVLEVINRIAKDKVKGSQGVIVIVAQDSERGFDMTASTINMTKDGVKICLEKMLEKVKGGVNGIIYTGKTH